jgi:hypothetical protein
VFTLSLEKPRRPRPVTERRLPAIQAPGIQPIVLPENARIEQGNEYRWSVRMQLDEKSPSKDIVATGGIRRTNAWPALKEALSKVPVTESAIVYAEHGLWYDALEALTHASSAPAAEQRRNSLREAMLLQVGLTNCVAR